MSTAYHPYTADPGHNPTVIFPTYGVQVIPTLVNFLGLSIISFLSARRTVFDDLGTVKGWLSLSWARLCVILVFISSWLFLFAAGLIVSGLGLSASTLTCQLGIFACIILYVSTKLLIYAFLIEKVWIVWSPKNTATGKGSRWSSPIYRVCLIVIFPYLGVLVLMIFGRIADLRHDGTCIIGLSKIASMSLLSFDLFLTFFLTTLFVWPLRSSKLISPKLRQVAKRTLAASFMALVTSAINIGVLTIMHGKQLGWVCLSSCGADVTVNAIVLYWVTSGTAVAKQNPDYTPPAGHPGAVCSLGVPASLHNTHSDTPMLASYIPGSRRGSVPKSSTYSFVSGVDPRSPQSDFPNVVRKWRKSRSYDGGDPHNDDNYGSILDEKTRDEDEDRRLGIIRGLSTDDYILFTSDLVKRRSMASLAEERRRIATRQAQEELKQGIESPLEAKHSDDNKDSGDSKSVLSDSSSVEPPSTNATDDPRPSTPGSPNLIQPPRPAQLRSVLPLAVPIRPVFGTPSAPPTRSSFTMNVFPPGASSPDVSQAPDRYTARRSVPHLFPPPSEAGPSFFKPRMSIPTSPLVPSAYRHTIAVREESDVSRKMKESRKLSYDFASSSSPITQTTSLPGRLTATVLPLKPVETFGTTGGHRGPLPDEHYEFPPRPTK